MSRLITVIVCMVAVAISSCNTSNTEKNTATISKTDSAGNQASVVRPVEVKAKEIVAKTIDYYLLLKDALVKDDAAETARQGKELKEYLDKVDKSVVDSTELSAFSKIEKELKDHSDHISKNEKDIIHQREHFSMMSDNLYMLIDRFGADRTLYRDYCPMYNDNEGAFWLSESEEIKNPYFGNKMLTCGRVKSIIK
jgi:hypothetical protein